MTWRFDGAAVEIGEPHALGREHRHIAVGQKKHVARVAEDGRHVGRDEVFAVAQPDHHRRPGARGHDLVRIRTARSRPARRRRSVP